MTKTFTADTQQEANDKAESFMQTLDPYEQAHIAYWGKNSEGKYYATVKSYGLD
jgi:hypothetical protein